MAGFIARQPNGLLGRHSTIVDCVTDYNMTEEEYINLCAERAAEEAKREAKEVLEGYIRPFQLIKDYFAPNNMTQEEFERILEDMSRPKELCSHTTT